MARFSLSVRVRHSFLIVRVRVSSLGMMYVNEMFSLRYENKFVCVCGHK